MGAYCLFCFAVAYFLSSFAIISLGKRELGALVCSKFRIACVLWIFLVVPWVGLSYVVVAFPGNILLSFWFSCCITGQICLRLKYSFLR